jgi:uncharacterized membrane protein (UPF0127 family)
VSLTAARARVLDARGVLVGEVFEARTAWSRMVGLLAHAHVPIGEGVLLAPAWSIHTWFMRASIDVVFLDREHRVLRVFPALGPWRLVSGTRKAHTVLEFGAGTLARVPLAPGDVVRIEHGDMAIASR